MTHPGDDLQDLALSLLPAEQAERVRAHAESCPECRRELLGFREALGALAAGLEPVAPPARVWNALLTQVRSPVRPTPASRLTPPARATLRRPAPRRAPWPWAAFSAALAVASLALASLPAARPQFALNLVATAEAILPVLGQDGQLRGRALLLDGDRCLIVLGETAPSGFIYQAWGRRGAASRLLASTSSDRMSVPYEGLDGVQVRLQATGATDSRLVATIHLD